MQPAAVQKVARDHSAAAAPAYRFSLSHSSIYMGGLARLSGPPPARCGRLALRSRHCPGTMRRGRHTARGSMTCWHGCFGRHGTAGAAAAYSTASMIVLVADRTCGTAHIRQRRGSGQVYGPFPHPPCPARSTRCGWTPRGSRSVAPSTTRPRASRSWTRAASSWCRSTYRRPCRWGTGSIGR